MATFTDTIIKDINKILRGTKPKALLIYEYIIKREDKIIKAFGGGAVLTAMEKDIQQSKFKW